MIFRKWKNGNAIKKKQRNFASSVDTCLSLSFSSFCDYASTRKVSKWHKSNLMSCVEFFKMPRSRFLLCVFSSWVDFFISIKEKFREAEIKLNRKRKSYKIKSELHVWLSFAIEQNEHIFGRVLISSFFVSKTIEKIK